MDEKKYSIETMTHEDKVELRGFLMDIRMNPDFQKYCDLMRERYEIVLEQILNTEGELPYRRGYAVGCLHTANFADDFITQIGEQIEEKAKGDANEAEGRARDNDGDVDVAMNIPDTQDNETDNQQDAE